MLSWYVSGDGYPRVSRGLNFVPSFAHFSPHTNEKKLYIRLNGLSVPDALSLHRTFRKELNLKIDKSQLGPVTSRHG
jgi:hypothetical protein